MERRLAASRNPFTMAFYDRELEAAYRRQEFDRNERWSSWMLIAGSLLALVFVGLDKHLLRPEAVQATSLIRAFIVSPIPLVGLVASFLLRKHLLARDLFVTGGLVVLGSMWTVLLTIGGTSSVSYHTVALVHTLMFGFFLLDLPFRIVFPAGFLIAAVFIAGVRLIGSPAEQLLIASGAVFVVLLISAFGLYRYESVSRANFVAQRTAELSNVARQNAERDRLKWLEHFAGFLRHELRNSIAGIASSLELMGRLLAQPPGSEYLGRALRSLRFMRRMLEQVAEASTLEDALMRQTRESVNVSRLVADRLADFCAETPSIKIKTDIAPDLYVEANADSLVQLLDKVINNAVEHTDESAPIHVRVFQTGTTLILEVANYGDALPSDTERLFLPFVSGRDRAGSPNLGLGLFVARAIASHHGGRIFAVPMSLGCGACIVLHLPIQDRPLPTKVCSP